MKDREKKTMMLTMRINEDTKQKIEDLAANKVFKYNSSALLTYLINKEHAKITSINEQ